MSEIRYVMAFASSCRPALNPGWAEYLLAWAEAAHNRTRARETARAALRLRRAYHPPGSREIAEAERLVEVLSGGRPGGGTPGGGG
jgi:hypothetical protein